jgi:hypothetical protein
MRKNVVWVAVLGLLFGLTTVSAFAQDFQKTYPVTGGGNISISNLSGDISVLGYGGTSIQVTAYREGRDADLIEIVDESSGNSVALSVRYPREGRHEGSVRFEVRVPQGGSYRFDSLKNASGDIEIRDVAGDINAKTASGDLNITHVQGTVNVSTASGDVTIDDVAGLVSARTASGDMEVNLTRVEGTGQLSFTSASGDVTVRVPGEISADIELSTSSGTAKSDFPLNMDEREHGTKLYGRIKSGAVPLKISTASGDVRLVRRS